MHLPKSTALLAIAAAGVAALAPTAGAQDTPTPKVTGAYLFVNTLHSTRERHATLVFRTSRRIQRRADGRIEAETRIADSGAPRLRIRSSRSTGSAATPPPSSRTTCYQTGVLIRKDNTIKGQKDGRTKITRARVGSKLPVEILIRTQDGFKRVTRTLTLRKYSRAYASGSALGC